MGTRPDLRQRQGEKRAEWIERVRQVQAAEKPEKAPGFIGRRIKKNKERAAVYGSQEWAETRGDDLGETN